MQPPLLIGYANHLSCIHTTTCASSSRDKRHQSSTAHAGQQHCHYHFKCLCGTSAQCCQYYCTSTAVEQASDNRLMPLVAQSTLLKNHTLHTLRCHDTQCAVLQGTQKGMHNCMIEHQDGAVLLQAHTVKDIFSLGMGGTGGCQQCSRQYTRAHQLDRLALHWQRLKPSLQQAAHSLRHSTDITEATSARRMSALAPVTPVPQLRVQWMSVR